MDLIVVVFVVLASIIIYKVYGSSQGSFKDPKEMTNHLLVSSIAGQAEWIDKMLLTD